MKFQRAISIDFLPFYSCMQRAIACMIYGPKNTNARGSLKNFLALSAHWATYIGMNGAPTLHTGFFIHPFIKLSMEKISWKYFFLHNLGSGQIPLCRELIERPHLPSSSSLFLHFALLSWLYLASLLLSYYLFSSSTYKTGTSYTKTPSSLFLLFFLLLLFPLPSYLHPWRGSLSPNQLKQGFRWSAPGPYYQSMTRSCSVNLSA